MNALEDNEVKEVEIQEDEEEDDGNVEVSLDDDLPDDDTGDKEDVPEEESVETFRKTSPELDTAAAITNILSEIVGDSDSRAVVGR